MQDLLDVKGELVKLDYAKIGKRIQKVRKQKKLTQADLAAICDCTSNHLSAIENGVNKPSLELMVRISYSLDKSIDYFLMDSPYAYPKYKIDNEISEKLNRCTSQMLCIVNDILDSLLSNIQTKNDD